MQFNFLAGLEKQTQNPVQKFQIFEAELGFERAKVKVPLQNATLFAVAEQHRLAMLQLDNPETYDYLTGTPAWPKAFGE